MLFNIYASDHTKNEGTCRFIYADDFRIAAQDSDLSIVEERFYNALNELVPFYEENHLRANLSKTQIWAMKPTVTWKSLKLGQAFHLKAVIIQYIKVTP